MVKFGKKGQSSALVTGLIFGVASLVIAVIIAFVIVSTLVDADLLEDNRQTITVLNEVGYLNGTGWTVTEGVDNARYVSGSAAVTGAVNYTNGSTITASLYEISDVGLIVNTSAANWVNVTYNYTYTLKTLEEFSTASLSGNMSGGVDNVSAKIPTVLLVAAIVLILSILVLLVGAWQSMRISGGGGI